MLIIPELVTTHLHPQGHQEIILTMSLTDHLTDCQEEDRPEEDHLEEDHLEEDHQEEEDLIQMMKTVVEDHLGTSGDNLEDRPEDRLEEDHQEDHQMIYLLMID